MPQSQSAPAAVMPFIVALIFIVTTFNFMLLHLDRIASHHKGS